MNKTLFTLRYRLPAALQSQGLILSLLYFLFYLSGVSWTPFYSVYLRQIGLSGLDVGTLSGIGPAVMLVSQPLWGMIADLRGRRRTLLLTMLATACLLPGFAGPAGFGFLFAWGILHACLSNPVSPLVDSLVLDHLAALSFAPQNSTGRTCAVEDAEHPQAHLAARGSGAFGQIRLWGAVGWAVGAFVVGRAIAGRDIRLIFAFASAFMFLAWLLVWRGVPEQAGRVSLGKNWRGAGGLLRNHKLVIFLALIVLMQLGTASIWTFQPIYMTELGAPRQMIGYAVALRGLSELPLYVAAAGLIRRFKSSRTFIFAILIFAGRAFLYSTIKTPTLAILVEASHGLSFSLFLVSAVDYIHRQVPPEWRATGQALFTAAFFGAGGILGNAWGGFFYDHLGVQPMFRLNGYLILAVAALAVLLLREGKQAGMQAGGAA